MSAFSTIAHSSSKTSPIPVRPLAATLLAMSIFCVGWSAHAQAPVLQSAPRLGDSGTQAAPAASSAYPAEEGAVPLNDASHVGIKMHGHWTINVKNADGTLVEHREFENSILLGGQNILLALMLGYQTPGDFAIQIGPSSGASPCVSSQNTTSTNYCFIVRSLSTSPATTYCNNYFYCGTGLSTTLNSSSQPNTLTLAGSMTANNTGTIGYVSSNLATCYIGNFDTTVQTNAPSTCPSGNGGSLATTSISGTTLGSPVSVSNGQIIQVSVVISFS